MSFFASGRCEPVGDELPCGHVEFAHNVGVPAASRQADERTRALGLNDVGAFPHPVLVLGGGQRVDVDDNVPLRRVLAVFLKGGAPPDPPRMARIAPEVVEILSAARYPGDAGVGVEHVERLRTHLLEPFTREPGQGGPVVPLHPVQRLLAVDGLEPQVRVIAHNTVCNRGPPRIIHGHGGILRWGMLTVPRRPRDTCEYHGSPAARVTTEYLNTCVQMAPGRAPAPAVVAPST